MLQLNTSTGRVDLVDTELTGGLIEIVGANMNICCDGEWSAGENGSAVTSAGDLQVRAISRNDAFSLAVTNRTDRNILLDDIRIRFTPTLIAEQWLEFIHLFNMETICGVKIVGVPTTTLDANPESHMVYMLRHTPSDNVTLIGALPPHTGDYMHFRALHDQPHMEGRFGLTIRSEQKRLLQPGQTTEASALTTCFGTDPWKVLCEYGDRFAARIPTPRDNRPRKLGWNSWDFFSGAVNENNILTHADATQIFVDAPWIVIDEGYEPRWGVWDANYKFPSGLEKLADEIRTKGALPGIWTAPLLVNQYTRLFLEHEEWFAQNADGQIAGNNYSYGPMGFLDPTIPEVRDWLGSIYRRLRKAGFEYFKVDFTQEILKADFFADPTVPKGRLIRLTFETIREAIGDNAYLLACGAPYESVTGIVDAVRTAGDIHIHYSHVRKNAKNFLPLSYMQGRLWNTDPDFLVMRCEELCPGVQLDRPIRMSPLKIGDAWRSGRFFSLEEAKTYAMLIIATGGDVILGDDLTRFTPEGEALIQRVLDSLLDAPATPLDFMTRHDRLPRLLLGKRGDKRLLIALNLDETPDCMKIDLSTLCVKLQPTDFWTGEAVETDGQILTIQLPRRSAKGFWFNSTD